MSHAGAVTRGRRATLVAALVALGSVAAGISLLDSAEAPSDPAATLAASAGGPSGEPRFESSTADALDATPGARSELPADIAPPEPPPVLPYAHERAVRGPDLRASDGSPVFGATVSALGADPESGRETVLERAHTDATGLFALRTQHMVERFVVTVPPPGAGRDDRRPGTSVPVRVEWAGGDPQANEVRLEVDTGWRLDLRVRDEAGQPRVGTVVSVAGLAATCDAEGQCVLLDLPAGPLDISLVTAPGAAPVMRRFVAPPAGQHRADATVTLP